ncbi:4-(cytidine 5'-diphospho)-2-C-methyl-D-erythritol kinase [Petrachloros mirabilis]
MTKSHSGSSSAPPPSSVTVLAPAKINLVLRILDRRADGFHNLWSIMQTVGLEDTIRIRLVPRGEDIQLRCDSRQLAADHSNLVYRAARAVLDRAGQSIGVEIELKKRIPMGAGLGGGSSDAAATLMGMNRLFRLGWSAAQMAEVGQTLGSDVPFFLFAPSGVVVGRGETVKPVRIAGRKWAVLVNPGFGVETKWAYHELASTRGGVHPLSSQHQDLEKETTITWEQVTKAAVNDFEAPVFARHLILEEIKRRLLSKGAEMALLSGSGATVFGLFSDEGQARLTEAHFSSMEQFKVYVVPTCSTPLTIKEP